MNKELLTSAGAAAVCLFACTAADVWDGQSKRCLPEGVQRLVRSHSCKSRVCLSDISRALLGRKWAQGLCSKAVAIYFQIFLINMLFSVVPSVCICLHVAILSKARISRVAAAQLPGFVSWPTYSSSAVVTESILCSSIVQ